MTKQEAMKILCDAAKDGNLIGGFVEAIHVPTNTQITLSMSDIILNLEINDYELNLDTIQDFCGEDGDMFQGYSLGELEITPF